jgi:hypothetical protein
VWKYFIELLIIIQPGPLMFQAGNFAGVALASIRRKCTVALSVYYIINILDQWTEIFLVGLLAFDRWQIRSLHFEVVFRSNDRDVFCQLAYNYTKGCIYST